jgi:hypothetical protein
MVPIAHVTVQESPLWVLVLLLGVTLGVAIGTAIAARVNRRN